VGLGLCDKPNVNFAQMPGWDSRTWGYHGDDGQKFTGAGYGDFYSELYGIGDTVGCGVDKQGNIFFTKNGVHLGVAFTGIAGQLFPIVGLSLSGRVTANFGAKPFKYVPNVLNADTSVTAGTKPNYERSVTAERKLRLADWMEEISDLPVEPPMVIQDEGTPLESGGAECREGVQGAESADINEAVGGKMNSSANAGEGYRDDCGQENSRQEDNATGNDCEEVASDRAASRGSVILDMQGRCREEAIV
ncbi:concanavalin A-like lectin/glucanase domain-containing protein, partial [Tricharina praecox]|uniref:concanavalin A-like lectin/glucanase domain-containing protein n=1 Tax=Tricharina praecox TaxID=43433 RepID=UPI00221F6BE3